LADDRRDAQPRARVPVINSIADDAPRRAQDGIVKPQLILPGGSHERPEISAPTLQVDAR
jgi:hypothetical protein